MSFAHELPRYRRDVRAAGQSHGTPQFVPEQSEGSRYALLASGGKRPQVRTADKHRPRTERKGLENVRPAPDPSVDENLDPPLDGVDDLRQRLTSAYCSVELPAAVVRHNNAL